MATNKHSYFIEQIETVLNTITGLNILTKFDMSKWTSYKFPYAYTLLQVDDLEYEWEEAYNYNGTIDFAILLGTSVSQNGDVRLEVSEQMLEVEKAFKGFTIPDLETDDYTIVIKASRITNMAVVPFLDERKTLYEIDGQIIYELIWNASEYHI